MKRIVAQELAPSPICPRTLKYHPVSGALIAGGRTLCRRLDGENVDADAMLQARAPLRRRNDARVFSGRQNGGRRVGL